MTTVACIVIATEKRRALVERRVMPSILDQGFDEVLLVGDWLAPMSDDLSRSYRYACVESFQRTTNDALVRRDVGTLMTKAPVICYLCDDHALAPTFLATLREVLDEPWDVLVPNRFCTRGFLKVGDPEENAEWKRFDLNNGERDGYCGGHAGVFRRSVITRRPWAAHSHTPYWDARSSYAMRLAGARFVWHPRAGIAIEDIEYEVNPNAQPWL